MVTVKVLKAGQIGSLLDHLAADATLVAPVDRGGMTFLRPVSDAGEVSLDYVLPVNSVKDFLFPHNEALYRYRTAPDSVEFDPVDPPGPVVVFGLRACDLASVRLLDQVFQTGDFDDAQYRLRREQTVLVGLACATAASTCLCRSFGVTPGASDGADIMLYPVGDDLLVQPISERGLQLLEGFSGAGEASAEDLANARAASDGLELPLAARVDVRDIEDRAGRSWDLPYWQELSMRCLGCGTCTFLCPTCHCFLLADVNRGKDGVRFKCWDSCQFASFLAGAGGHNPRPTRKERIRQRFMHKLSYYPERYGSLLCTGCGRCVARCPVDLHIAGVVSDLKEVSADD